MMPEPTIVDGLTVTPWPTTTDATAHRWDNIWPYSMRLHVCRECGWTARQSARFASRAWADLSPATQRVIANLCDTESEARLAPPTRSRARET